MKKINAGDDAIILKLQDKFHFDKDDAEFYYDYAMKTYKDKITDSNMEKPEEAVKETKNDRARRHEPILSMHDKENQEIGEERMLMLIQRLVADQRFDEIKRMQDDKSHRGELYREYHIVQ